MKTTLTNPQIADLKRQFISRLDTLQHLLVCASNTPGTDEALLLQSRIISDMHPLGTQIAFACNQPRYFSQWSAGEDVSNLNETISSFSQANSVIDATREQVRLVDVEDSLLQQDKKVALGGNLFITLVGSLYISEMLMPNFYFHLVTAYNILRMNGVQIGKREFMGHLAPFLAR